ncbi:MAG: type III pantothenate kinase [Clostridiales bacterium]|jgi:type III pantothenate kinase|nr:type III pantothenate kinase [Clostridiales bacterium]
MTLVMDIGNTNIKLGLFEGSTLAQSWRVSASKSRTADELGVMVGNLFASVGLTFRDVDGVIMASVQPALNYTVEHACEYYIGKKPLVVNTFADTGLKFLYTNPEELGADRIVNAIAAFREYGGPCVIVDCGTATTFSAVNSEGEFLGGAIAPGIKASADAMTDVASKLPKIELIKPKNIIGKSTISNMQSGVINGFTGLINHILSEMLNEPSLKGAAVIATGGLSELVDFDGRVKVIKDRALSLKGLKIIYDLNSERNNKIDKE